MPLGYFDSVTNAMWSAFQKRLLILAATLAGFAVFLVASNLLNPTVGAFSAGPPAGYTRAPGEEPEACAECHVPSGSGTGQITIAAPQTYIPGQTYQITVTHSSPDSSRQRWGFQLTALDDLNTKAGELSNLTTLTQIITGGPGGNRQYIEHGPGGTFPGQQFGANWTFNWTAPSTNVGVVTFYAAGNQANNDGNTSGDFVYSTFTQSQPASSSPPQLRLEQDGPDPNQAAALDSVLLIRDPFRVQSAAGWLDLGSDRNTRVMVFATNVTLNPGETASAVTVDLTDALNQSFINIAAEDVRPVANSDVSQIIFRLPNTLAAGTCSVKVKIHGLISNAGTLRIAP